MSARFPRRDPVPLGPVMSPEIFSAAARWNARYQAARLPEGTPESMIRYVNRSLSLSPRLVKYLAPTMEKVEGFWDFSRPPLRLALLDDKSFWDLSLKLGLAIWAPSLATELWSEAALKRRKSLGPLLKWALGRGRLSLTNEMRREIMEGLSGPPQDEEGFRLTGLKAMAMALGECPEEVMERNKDRFFLSEGLKVDGTLSGRVWIWIKKTLVEVAPLWKDCFK